MKAHTIFNAATLIAIIMMALPSFCFYSGFSTISSHLQICLPSTSSTCKTMVMMSSTTHHQLSEEEEDELIQKFSTLRSIGVDYGLTRTGVAITTGGYRPRPLTILSGLTTSELTTTIVKYVISERANNIVLGYPLNKNGTLSHQSSITKDFGLCLLQVVRQQCGNHINITLWDERYTSKEATSRIRAEAMARNEPVPSKSDLSTELDADAACIILEDYYKEMGINGEVIVIEDERIARECEEIYKQNIERDERIRKEMMEERERGRNARQLMIEKDRALEATKQDQNGGISSKKRKKKKKKKK